MASNRAASGNNSGVSDRTILLLAAVFLAALIAMSAIPAPDWPGDDPLSAGQLSRAGSSGTTALALRISQ